MWGESETNRSHFDLKSVSVRRGFSKWAYNGYCYWLQPGTLDCTFDVASEETCGWTNDASAELQWRRKSGGTPSSSTGPSGDHTSGTGMFYFSSTIPDKINDPYLQFYLMLSPDRSPSPPRSMLKWLHVKITLKNNTDIGGRGRRCNLVDGPLDFVCREVYWCIKKIIVLKGWNTYYYFYIN